MDTQAQVLDLIFNSDMDIEQIAIETSLSVDEIAELYESLD